MYTTPTFKKTDDLINQSVFENTEFDIKNPIPIPIKGTDLGKTGTKAYILKAMIAELSSEAKDVLLPTLNISLDGVPNASIFESLNLAQRIQIRTTGILAQKNGHVAFIYAETIRGASGMALKEDACTPKNLYANAKLQDEVASFDTKEEERQILIKMANVALQVNIQQNNKLIVREHSLKLPAFVLTVLHNQKSRTLNEESEEYKKYNKLALSVKQTKESIEAFAQTSSKADFEFIRDINRQLKSDIHTHLKNNMNSEAMDSNYIDIVSSLVDAIPDAPILTPANDEVIIYLAKNSNVW